VVVDAVFLNGGRVWVRWRTPDPLACTSFPLGSSGRA